jgi:charged multivesicular body protein 5
MDARVQDLESKIRKCDEDLRKYMGPGARGPSQKQMAMQVLKRKKMYEQQLQQMMGQQFNVDQLAFAQENIETTQMTVEAMREGSKQLQASYAKMDIGAIEDMMDDLAELNAEAQEINEVMAQNFAVPAGFDEAEFEDEFAALEEEMQMEKLAGLDAPSATSSRPAYLGAALPGRAPPMPSDGYAAGTEPTAPSAPVALGPGSS